MYCYSEKGFNYSGIINFGVESSDGEYIVQLNNDTELLTPNWLEIMLGFCQRSDVGGVGVKLYFPDETIQHAGIIVGIGGIAGMYTFRHKTKKVRFVIGFPLILIFEDMHEMDKLSLNALNKFLRDFFLKNLTEFIDCNKRQ